MGTERGTQFSFNIFSFVDFFLEARLGKWAEFGNLLEVRVEKGVETDSEIDD